MRARNTISVTKGMVTSQCEQPKAIRQRRHERALATTLTTDTKSYGILSADACDETICPVYIRPLERGCSSSVKEVRNSVYLE